MPNHRAHGCRHHIRGAAGHWCWPVAGVVVMGLQHFPVLAQVPVLCAQPHGHVLAVVDGAMHLRGPMGSEAYRDAYRWDEPSPFWLVAGVYESAMAVVDDFGELVEVITWNR